MLIGGYSGHSGVTDSALTLALAPALTPSGLTTTPSFFHGFATHPRAFAQGLVTLADITATQYYRPIPAEIRDPILTAHGDRLRAEVFSADTSVYARLDLLRSGLDGGEIGYGTTNVDVNAAMRQMLIGISGNELLHVDVGTDGLSVSTPGTTATERPVTMPPRWLRALGNAAEIHTRLTPLFSVEAGAARTFLSALPPSSSVGRHGWLTPTPTGIRVAPRRPASGAALHVDGLQRLSSLKRLLALVQRLTFYGTTDGGKGPSAVEAELPGARLLVALTETTPRGYSGEGALLTSLAAPDVLENARALSTHLAFDPVINTERLARETGTDPADVRAALAVLAASGRVGWDPREGAWFHRELPDRTDRIAPDNPRLVRARELLAAGAVTRVSDASGELFTVRVPSGTQFVRPDATATTGHSCTCVWTARHGDGRGPCAHVLAVTLLNHDLRSSQEKD